MIKAVVASMVVVFLVAGVSTGFAQQSGSMKLSDQDKAFIQDMAEGGMFEVQAAKMAEQKAASPQVKDYARKLLQDHAQADQQLMQFARSNNLQLPSQLSGKYRDNLNKLSGLSGQQFDKEFLNMQLKDHQDDILKSQKEVNAGKDPDLIQFARRNQVVLEQHLETAQNLSGRASSDGASQKSASAR